MLIMLIAVSGSRLPSIQPRIRGLLAFKWRSMWRQICGTAARCGGDLHKSAKSHMAKLVRRGSTRSLTHCAVLRHLRLTLDTTDIMHRAQRRGSWNGLCERQIDGLARFGIRRHLRRRAFPVSRQCEKRALGLKASLASGHKASRGP